MRYNHCVRLQSHVRYISWITFLWWSFSRDTYNQKFQFIMDDSFGYKRWHHQTFIVHRMRKWLVYQTKWVSKIFWSPRWTNNFFRWENLLNKANKQTNLSILFVPHHHFLRKTLSVLHSIKLVAHSASRMEETDLM